MYYSIVLVKFYKCSISRADTGYWFAVIFYVYLRDKRKQARIQAPQGALVLIRFSIIDTERESERERAGEREGVSSDLLPLMIYAQVKNKTVTWQLVKFLISMQG